MKEVQEALRDLPLTSFRYHSKRNDFSRWLRAQSLYMLAKKIKNINLDTGMSDREVRDLLYTTIRDYRSEQTRIANNAAVASMAGNLVTGIAGMAAGGAGVGAAVGALGSAINTGIGIAQRNAETQAANEFSKLNESLTLDNMRSAPDAIRNAQGNILFTMLFQHDPSLFCEIYEALDTDSRKMLDYMNMYGFKYGLIGNVKDFDNVRARFNYIAANVDIIDFPLSDTEHERLKQALRSVRFWNGDSVSYDLENYERSLEDGE